MISDHLDFLYDTASELHASGKLSNYDVAMLYMHLNEAGEILNNAETV